MPTKNIANKAATRPERELDPVVEFTSRGNVESLLIDLDEIDPNRCLYRCDYIIGRKPGRAHVISLSESVAFYSTRVLCDAGSLESFDAMLDWFCIIRQALNTL